LQRDFTPTPVGLTKEPAFGAKPAGSHPELFIDELALGAPANQPAPPALQDFRVDDPTPIVHTTSTHRTLVLAGDGEGLVDASDIGLLRGAGAVVYAASYDRDPKGLRRVLGNDGTVVITDSNRRRARRWSTLIEDYGYTEQRGEKPYGDTVGDARLDVFPGETEDAYTVTDQRGVKRVVATAYGNPISYTSEDRPSQSMDGDVETAWKAQAFDNAIGQRLHIETERPVTTDHVNLVQPLEGPRDRFITQVRLLADGKPIGTYTLGDASRTREGQTIRFGRHTFSTFDLEVVNVNTGHQHLYGGESAVGFAEVRLRDEHAAHDLRVDEVIDLPTDALKALGAATESHPLIYVMQRERTLLVPPRGDPEKNISRAFVVPTARTFSLTGNARLTADANDAALERALGLPSLASGGIRASTSFSLNGCVACRPGSAIDGDPTTAWNGGYAGAIGQWIQYDLSTPVTFDHMNLQVVADGRHSVPTRLRIEAGKTVREVDVPPVRDVRGRQNATATVSLRFPALTGRRVRITITGARDAITHNFSSTKVLLPPAIAELGIPGIRLAPLPARVQGECRTDLLTIDGRPFPVRVSGDSKTMIGMGPATVVPCDPRRPTAFPTVTLAPGQHVVRTAPGQRTGIELDRLVLASDAGGAALATGNGRVTGLPDRPPSTPAVKVLGNGRTKVHLRIRGADEPFWLVLGESRSDGWQATVKGSGALGKSKLVDGYANGWRIDPKGRNVLDVTLEWTPQRRVWASLALSVLGVVLAIALVVASFVRRRVRARVRARTAPPVGEGDVELVAPFRPLGERTPRWALVAGPLVGGAIAALVVGPAAGVLVAVLLAVALRYPRARAVLTLAPVVLLGFVASYVVVQQLRFRLPPIFEWPTLFPHAEVPAWLAIVLLSADAFVELLRTPHRPLAGAATAPADEPEPEAEPPPADLPEAAAGR
jgi:hypothetical protein